MSDIDELDAVLCMDERIQDEAFEEGREIGLKQGEEQGYNIGYAKGVEIGLEIGFYFGYTEYHTQLASNYPPRALHLLTELAEMVANFEFTNNQEVDIEGILTKLRSKFKIVNSIIKGKKMEQSQISF